MEESTFKQLSQLVMALKSLARTVERGYHAGMFDSVGDHLVKTYRGLHKRVAELVPDDYYVTELLILELSEKSNDEQKMVQVRLFSDQLLEYLQSLLRAEEHQNVLSDNIPKGLGRELQDEILQMTKKIIRRAVSHIEIDVNEGQIPTEDEPNNDAGND
jgi:hypothetical protein